VRGERDDAWREEWLQRALTGELHLDAPESKELLARRPDLAERLEALRKLQSGLTRIGATERAAIAAARSDTTAADRAKLAALRERVRPSNETRAAAARPVPRRWPLYAAAFVAAAGMALWFAFERAPSPDAPSFLGGGPPSRWGALRRVGARHDWSAPAGAETFSVHFFALSAGRRSPEELFSRSVAESTWVELSVEELALLPDAGYVWEVRAFALGQLRDTALATEAAGWRSR
jgi:hypothetical protein